MRWTGFLRGWYFTDTLKGSLVLATADVQKAVTDVWTGRWFTPRKRFRMEAARPFLKKGKLVAQLCLTLCDPMDCSPPGSSVHGDSPGKDTAVGCPISSLHMLAVFQTDST